LITARLSSIAISRREMSEIATESSALGSADEQHRHPDPRHQLAMALIYFFSMYGFSMFTAHIGAGFVCRTATHRARRRRGDPRSERSPSPSRSD
jgi:hypothetical protein